jgi:hypothetical protein
MAAPRLDTGRPGRIGVGGARGTRAAFFPRPFSGATATPRKTNYDFERRERERSKAADAATKAKAKADRKASQQETPDAASTSDP